VASIIEKPTIRGSWSNSKAIFNDCKPLFSSSQISKLLSVSERRGTCKLADGVKVVGLIIFKLLL
jgi:hypothetical protein